tara:strand:- start:683 stop:1471 length:789 start_codon:yes stop_codon:yes gene_type:complete
MYYSVYSLNDEVVKGETPVRNLSSKIQNIKHQTTLEEARNHRIIKERNEIRDKLVNVYLPLLQNCNGKLFAVHITPQKAFLLNTVNGFYTQEAKESFVVDLYELLVTKTPYHLSKNIHLKKNNNRFISGCFVVEQRSKEGAEISHHIHAIWRVDGSIKIPFTDDLMKNVINKGSMQISCKTVPLKNIIKDIKVEEITEEKGGLLGALQYQNKWAIDEFPKDRAKQKYRATTWFSSWTAKEILKNNYKKEEEKYDLFNRNKRF